MFAMRELWEPSIARLALYTLLGAIVGFGSIVATRAVSAVEEGFEMLPIHWMWWPAIGGLLVGAVGYFVPDTNQAEQRTGPGPFA